MSATALGDPPAATPAREASRRDRPPRDPWFDNAKMLLVALVVVGHSWTLLPETPVIARLYDWLYLWHIPAFVMVTGYLSRSFTYRPRHLRRLLTTVAFPYLAFEGLFALFRVHVGGETLERLWLNPHWPMWYLAVLFLWRLATPVIRRLPAPVAVGVGVSLLGGLVDVETLDVNRALGLLPFYVLGLTATPERLDRLRTRAVRLAGPVVLAAAVPFTAVLEGPLHTEWLYYRRSYAALDAGWLEGVAVRGLLLAMSTAMALAVLAWVPRRGGWFAALGAGSLVVYLFHGFVVKAAEYAGFADWADPRPWTALLVSSVVSLVLALGLSWRPVRRPLEKVVTPAP